MCSSLLHIFSVFLLTGAISLGTRPLGAQNAPLASSSPASVSTSPQPLPYWANRGHWTFGLQIGYAVENAIPRNISHINLLIVQPHLGFIVHNFRRSPLQRFEILNEGILGNAVHPGGHLLGTSLLFRFNGSAAGPVVPFLDMGAGVLHTTLSRRAPELSGHLQFLPQAGVGIQYFFRPGRAVVFEYRYIHMSNAGIEPPNHGFNGSMLSIGFRWYRRPRATGPQAPRHSHNPFRHLLGGSH
jgi:hypothetical protein